MLTLQRRAAHAEPGESIMKRLILLCLGLACCAPAFAATPLPVPHRSDAHQGLAAERQPLVDLNSASKAELVRLPGVGAAIADRILAGRPWRSKYDLVVKKVVSRSTYEKFARFVVARQPG